jgi:hypothetical protein
MTIASEPQLKSGDERSSPPPLPSTREKIQQHDLEGAVETTIILPKNGGQDPEKSEHTHDNGQEEDSRPTASRTAPASPEIAAYPPTLTDNFGRENSEYISGYKLFAALLGIISVFFIVLLDFSIISTVSTDSPQNHCVPRVLYRCAR